MLAEATIARIEAQVPALALRTSGALELAAMMKTKTLAQAPVSAFVIPAGYRAAAADTMAGAYIQELSAIVAIVLVLRSADASGAKAIPSLDELTEAVTRALAGWMPEGEEDSLFTPIGDFTFSRGQLVGLDAGVVYFQLEFACPVQLRNLS